MKESTMGLRVFLKSQKFADSDFVEYLVWRSDLNMPPLKVRMQLHKGFWSNFGILSFCVPTFSDRQQHERQILVQNTNFYINVTSERTGDDNRKVVMKTFIDASWCITCIVWELGVTMGYKNFWCFQIRLYSSKNWLRWNTPLLIYLMKVENEKSLIGNDVVNNLNHDEKFYQFWNLYKMKTKTKFLEEN